MAVCEDLLLADALRGRQEGNYISIIASLSDVFRRGQNHRSRLAMCMRE